jgi:DNA-binding response OmpR family regulator
MIRILLIGADLDGLNELEASLQLQHFETIKTQDGELGLQLMQEYQPSLVICDQIEANYEGVPLLLITESTEQLGLEGVNYLVKPFTQADLLEVVHRCLELAVKIEPDEGQQQQYIQALEQQISHYQELTDLYRLLLKQFSQEVCHPIANISLVLQLLAENPGEMTVEDRSILEDECARAISLLNQIATFQELLQSSKLAILRQLLYVHD